MRISCRVDRIVSEPDFAPASHHRLPRLLCSTLSSKFRDAPRHTPALVPEDFAGVNNRTCFSCESGCPAVEPGDDIGDVCTEAKRVQQTMLVLLRCEEKDPCPKKPTKRDEQAVTVRGNSKNGFGVVNIIQGRRREEEKGQALTCNKDNTKRDNLTS